MELTPRTFSAYLGHLVGNLVPGTQRFNERARRHERPLDRAGQFARHVAERVELLHVLRHAAQVQSIKCVLRVQHLGRERDKVSQKMFLLLPG